MLDDELMSSMRAEILGEETTATDKEDIHESTKDEPESDESNAKTESNKVDEETESSEFDNESESSELDEEDSTKNEQEDTKSTVYWTKSGGVYHLYKDCGYIKSSSEVLSGSVEEALEEGKSGTCSRCQSRKDKE